METNPLLTLLENTPVVGDGYHNSFVLRNRHTSVESSEFSIMAILSIQEIVIASYTSIT